MRGEHKHSHKGHQRRNIEMQVLVQRSHRTGVPNSSTRDETVESYTHIYIFAGTRRGREIMQGFLRGRTTFHRMMELLGVLVNPQRFTWFRRRFNKFTMVPSVFFVSYPPSQFCIAVCAGDDSRRRLFTELLNCPYQLRLFFRRSRP